MRIQDHIVSGSTIAEVLSDTPVIKNVDDGSDLLGNVYYQNFDGVIVYEKDITPLFFDLKTGIAGEILQKFSNHRMRLIIVGDFSKYNSQSLCQFIVECNKGKQVNFVSDRVAALECFSP